MTNYSINQEIAYNDSRNYLSATFIRFTKIKSITKTGRLTLEDGRKFNPAGLEIKSKNNPYPRAYIVDLNLAYEIANK